MKKLTITTAIIDRDPAYVSYIRQISKYRMLTQEEETQLGLRIQQGDEKAAEELANANLRFVVSVASQYHVQHLDLLDLISEGNIGILQAARTFDPARGIRFISYAVWHIRQAIMGCIDEHTRMVRLPYARVVTQRKIASFAAEFVQREYREPTPEEMADGTGIALHVVKDILGASGVDVSLSVPCMTEAQDRADSMLDDALRDDDDDVATDHSTIQDSDHRLLHSVLRAVLRPRETEVLFRLYGIGCEECKIVELAREMGISNERVRQLRDDAIRKIRRSDQRELLREIA